MIPRPAGGLAGAKLSGTASVDMAPTEAGQVVYLSWVSEDRIPAEHRKFVRRHTDRAARLMGINGHVKIRWFGPAVNGGDFTGVAPFADALPMGVMPADAACCPEHDRQQALDFPMTIALLAGARGEMVAAIIAHEVRHLAQHILGEMLGSQAAREEDADHFALAYLASEGLR
jgi:hypothetical protein